MLLVLNGLVLTRTAIEYMYEYVRGSFAGGMPRDLPTLVTLAGLFVMDVFEGPALALLTPFMGCSHCAVGAINLLAAAFFCKGEAVQRCS